MVSLFFGGVYVSCFVFCSVWFLVLVASCLGSSVVVGVWVGLVASVLSVSGSVWCSSCLAGFPSVLGVGVVGGVGLVVGVLVVGVRSCSPGSRLVGPVFVRVLMGGFPPFCNLRPDPQAKP